MAYLTTGHQSVSPGGPYPNPSGHRQEVRPLTGDVAHRGLPADTFPGPGDQVRTGPRGLTQGDTHEARLRRSRRLGPPVRHLIPDGLGQCGGDAAMSFAVAVQPVGVP